MGRWFSFTVGTLWGILGIVLILFFVGVYFYFTQVANASIGEGNLNDGENVNLDVLPGDEGSDSLGYENNEDSGINNNGESVAGGGEAGGGETQGFQGGCTLQQVSYGLKNFRKNETCNSYSGEDCVDKSYYCSLDIVNIDSNVAGTFGVNFILKIDGQSRETNVVSDRKSVV